MLSSMLSRAFPSRTPPGTLPGAAVVIIMAAGLSACGPTRPQFAPACPQTGILSDAADITTFRGTGTDLTDMVLDGRITGLSGKCSSPDMDHLQTQISVNMELGRGPAMQGRTADVTYFVSVARGDTILDKRDYTLHAAFHNPGSRLRLTGDQIDIALPIPGKVTGADYRILVGFQLSPSELAFNRRRGPR
jgi:hypothetical protein